MDDYRPTTRAELVATLVCLLLIPLTGGVLFASWAAQR